MSRVNKRWYLSARLIVGLMVFLCYASSRAQVPAGSAPIISNSVESQPLEIQQQSQPRRQLFSGQVVKLAEALARKGIRHGEEVAEHLVLETPSGRLLPILSDWRGKAFYQDERLRNRPVELVGFLRPDMPYLQVLMVFTFDEQGRRMFTDYWCDVCAIAMYEIKPCECCQQETRMRFQAQEIPEGVLPWSGH